MPRTGLIRWLSGAGQDSTCRPATDNSEFLNAGTCSWKLFSTLGVSTVLDDPSRQLTTIQAPGARDSLLELVERRLNRNPAVREIPFDSMVSYTP